MALLVKNDIAINPVAHVFRLDTLPILASALDSQDRSAFNTPSGESNHFAIIRTAWVGAAAREIEEDLLRRNE